MTERLLEIMGGLGPLGVGLLMVLENLFPPIPSEVIMAAAGFAASRGELALVPTILAGTAGTVLGNAAWYEAARAVGPGPAYWFVRRYGRWLGLAEEDLDRGVRLLATRGAWIVFGARFLPGLRTLISLPAGAARMPRLLFYPLTALGSAIWITFLAWAGWTLGENFEQVDRWVAPLGIVVVALSVGLYAWHLWNTRDRRRRGAPPAA